MVFTDEKGYTAILDHQTKYDERRITDRLYLLQAIGQLTPEQIEFDDRSVTETPLPDKTIPLDLIRRTLLTKKRKERESNLLSHTRTKSFLTGKDNNL